MRACKLSKNTSLANQAGVILPLLAVMLGSLAAVMFVLYLNYVKISHVNATFRNQARNICRLVSESENYNLPAQAAAIFSTQINYRFREGAPILGNSQLFRLTKANIILPTALTETNQTHRLDIDLANYTPYLAAGVTQSPSGTTFAAAGVSPNCGVIHGGQDCRLHVQPTGSAADLVVPSAFHKPENAMNTFSCLLEGEVKLFDFASFLFNRTDEQQGWRKIVANYSYFRQVAGEFSDHHISKPPEENRNPASWPGLHLAVSTHLTTYSHLPQYNWEEMVGGAAADYLAAYNPVNGLLKYNTIPSYPQNLGEAAHATGNRRVPMTYIDVATPGDVNLHGVFGQISGNSRGGGALTPDSTEASDLYEALLSCSNPVTLVRNMFLATFAQYAARHGQARYMGIYNIGTQNHNTADSVSLWFPDSAGDEMRGLPSVINKFGFDILSNGAQLPAVHYYSGTGEPPAPEPEPSPPDGEPPDPSPSAEPSVEPSASPSAPAASPDPSASPAGATPSPSAPSSASASPVPSIMPSASPSASVVPSMSGSPAPSASASAAPSQTASPAASVGSSPTPSTSPSASASQSFGQNPVVMNLTENSGFGGAASGGDGGNSGFPLHKNGWINPIAADPLPETTPEWLPHHALVAGMLRMCAHLYIESRLDVPHAGISTPVDNFHPSAYGDSPVPDDYQVFSEDLESFDQACPWIAPDGHGVQPISSQGCVLSDAPVGRSTTTGQKDASTDAITTIAMLGSTQSCVHPEPMPGGRLCLKPNNSVHDLAPDYLALVKSMNGHLPLIVPPGIFPPRAVPDSYKRFVDEAYSDDAYSPDTFNTSAPLIIVTHKAPRHGQVADIAAYLTSSEWDRPIFIVFIPANANELARKGWFNAAFLLDSFSNRKLFTFDPQVPEDDTIDYTTSDLGFAQFHADLILSIDNDSLGAGRLKAENAITEQAKRFFLMVTNKISRNL